MLKINGIDISTLNINEIYGPDESMTPEIRVAFEERGSYGSINYGVTHGNSVFNFSLQSIGDIRGNIEKLKKLFLDENGSYKDVIVEWDKWNGKTYVCTLTSPIRLKPDQSFLGYFSLELTATDPFAKDILETVVSKSSVNLARNGDLEIPIDYPGTHSTGFKVEVNGNISAFTIDVLQKNSTKKTFKYRNSLYLNMGNIGKDILQGRLDSYYAERDKLIQVDGKQSGNPYLKTVNTDFVGSSSYQNYNSAEIGQSSDRVLPFTLPAANGAQLDLMATANNAGVVNSTTSPGVSQFVLFWQLINLPLKYDANFYTKRGITSDVDKINWLKNNLTKIDFSVISKATLASTGDAIIRYLTHYDTGLGWDSTLVNESGAGFVKSVKSVTGPKIKTAINDSGQVFSTIYSAKSDPLKTIELDYASTSITFSDHFTKASNFTPLISNNALDASEAIIFDELMSKLKWEFEELKKINSNTTLLVSQYNQLMNFIGKNYSTLIILDFLDFSLVDNGVNGLEFAEGDFLYINKNTSKIIFKGDIKGNIKISYSSLYV